jgi:chemotaxis protein CheX
MSVSDTLMQSYRAEDFLSGEKLDHADEAVIEVFRMMLGFDIFPVDLTDLNPTTHELEERTAIVGFSGSMRGSCQVRINCIAATSIASAMLGGMPIEEGDDCINDALGELCNMIAGSWKNAVPALACSCALSPPTVISGFDYQVHTRKPSASLSRRYRFDIHTLHLLLRCESVNPPQTDVETLPFS